MRSILPGLTCIAVLLLSGITHGYSQCTAPGQNPSTAFPVCGTTTFVQNSVPICSSTDLFVPGCQDGAAYANKNPFWYKFTCFVSGTLGFVITPNNLNDDYDWQLYDVTGLSPDQVYTNQNIIVAGNWSGSSGTTGASASGFNGIQCASSPADNAPTFAKMPNLIAGHEYILLVSHYTDSQSGYSLSFGGGTAVITDPATPHLQRANIDCDGQEITLKLNKRMRCNSLTTAGTEFTLLPALATVTGVTPVGCANGFDFDSVTIRLSAPLPAGNYSLVVNNGTDGNTILDACGRGIAEGETTPFTYIVPVPIFADSIGTVGCAPDEVIVYFPKKIDCSTLEPSGTDFSVTGPSAVSVVSANGNCVNGETGAVRVRFSSPIVVGGLYTLTLKAGVDGTTIVDECGLELPVQTLQFIAADTVSAEFSYTTDIGCRMDTLTFSHNGAHGVNSWNWTFNTLTVTTQQHTISWPASSTNNVKLVVSNGVCKDSAETVIVLDNEVKAAFDMPDIICPEDPLVVTNNSSGLVDIWQWKFGTISTSNVKDPQPVQFPSTNIETVYNIKLLCTNTTLGCTDSITKKLKVLDNCFIAVPTGFTPNNDGINDHLYPNNAIKAENLEFSVYNRWGQQVFHSRDWTRRWDGKVNGVEQASGVYVWFLRYTHRDTKKKVFQKGTTTLIR